MVASDASLYGRAVFHVSGMRMGRIEAVVRAAGGERLAVVRRRRFVRRWYCVPLAGAAVVDGRVVVRAGYGRGVAR